MEMFILAAGLVVHMSKRRKGKLNKQDPTQSEPRSQAVAVADPGQVEPASTEIVHKPVRSQLLLMALGLIIITAAVYAPVRNYDFIRWDDPQYVSENPFVTGGLKWNNVVWAFTTGHAANWHPITWLSHMLDVELFGLNAGRHHLISVLIHIVNTVLLFLLLCRITGARGKSAVVAALFAVHPLHVESVAWIAERKDVLSTFFWISTVWAYVAYLRRSVPWRYGLILLLYALGSMSKPMLVTLPFVLLLLDVWPLERVALAAPGQRRWGIIFAGGQQSKLKSLVIEKLPLFAIAITLSIITFFVQRNTGGIAELGALPLSVRVGTALVGYGKYIFKMFWPARLSALYPQTGSVDGGEVMLSVLLLISVSVLVFFAARKHPYLLVGWLLFLGVLVPVIGLVQVGPQSMADRYTYVPMIGLFIMVTWGTADLLARLKQSRIVLPAAALTSVCVFAVVARNQVGYWKSGFDLWGHAVSVTRQNHMAENNFGVALAQRGRVDEAINYFRNAINIKPDYVEAHGNLAVAFNSQNKIADAINEYAILAQIKPNDPAAQITLAGALMGAGRFAEATAHYSAALRIRPTDADTHNNLGLTLANQGKIDEAIREFQEAARQKPGEATFEYNLGVMLIRKGNPAEALSHIETAVKIKPDYPDAVRALQALKSGG